MKRHLLSSLGWLMGVLALSCAPAVRHPVHGPSERPHDGKQLASPSGAVSWSFDSQTRGQAPPGFTVVAGQFKVVPDHTSRACGAVLGQFAESAASVFNLVLVKRARYRDVDIAVSLRAAAGKVDRGGGVVWRARDARNYYIARYNPLEDNVRVYVVTDGKRRMIAGSAVRVERDGWHTLRVRMIRDHIFAYLDSAKVVEARDTTFRSAGSIGLWTKADARTHFDDLMVGPAGNALDAKAIGTIVGTSAKTTADGAVRVMWPRNDVAVRIDGWQFPVAAGLTSWAGFVPMSDGKAMLMGDTVVFQDEVDVAMDAAFSHNISITALHNHFFFDEPRVYFMHLGGRGDAASLAKGVRAVWQAIRRVRKAAPVPAKSFSGTLPSIGRIDASRVSKIVGADASRKNGGVVKVSVSRRASMHATWFGGSMGLSSWAAFSGSDAQAAIDGDFAMREHEVQPVLRALRNEGFHVVALHNHMIGETPGYYFTHFWAKGTVEKLARGFRRALNAQWRALQTRTH